MSRVYRNYLGRTEGKFHFDRVDMKSRIISKWIRKTQGIMRNFHFTWLMTGTTGGLE
jgi:hypothetical protein